MGLTTNIESALLDGTALFGATRYLRLIQWTGDPNAGAGQELNEDGTLAANMAEVSTGGYAAHQVLATEWGAAVPGAPTTKQFPKATGTGVTFTPTGGASWSLCAYAWTTNNSVIGTGNVISTGVFLDANGDPALITVDGTHPLVISPVFPIIERMGDPPAGVDPI